jgi:hypothetical protein
MTLIQGYQIEDKSLNFDKFKQDENGNIIVTYPLLNLDGYDFTKQQVIPNYEMKTEIFEGTLVPSTSFTIKGNPEGILQVFYNGERKIPEKDYKYDSKNKTLSFEKGLGNNDILIVDYLSKI